MKSKKELRSEIIGFLVIAILSVTAVALIGIMKFIGSPIPAVAEAEVSQQRFNGLTADRVTYDVFYDNVSGVYYALFFTPNGVAVTPLYNIDGLPMCVDDANHGVIESTLKDIHGNQLNYQEQETN